MSYVWQSILQGLNLLKQGIIWRVGDGTNIKIWDDRWIPRGVTRRPMTHRGNNLLSRVCDLIYPTSGEWDEGLVQQTFRPGDAREILHIPISEQGEDFITWHFDSKGLFSVKLVYHVMIDQERRLLTRAMGESSSGDDWKKESWRGL